MQLVTTISRKGQVVVPKKVREEIGLSTSDLLRVEAKDGKVVMSPVSKTDEVFGLFKVKGVITKSDVKSSFRKAVLAKSIKME
jgi:AbrB family looped-hinge helix DNA binding protein